MNRLNRPAHKAVGALWLVLALCCASPSVAAQEPAQKILRYAFPIAETGFDPAQVSDLYSRNVNSGLFESLLTYDYLARPFKLKPQTTTALPEVSPDFKTFTFRIKPGIHFADDPVFGGKKRELVAQDFVFSLKRHFDPRWKSPNLFQIEHAKIVGLNELRNEVLASKKPFPYEREVEGLRALDRYTLQIKLAEPAPRFGLLMADPAFGVVAREVVEAYGENLMAHPVGTGPFVLAEWRRSSRIVLTRNPNYRERLYDAEAPADDARLQAIAKRLHGRRLPMVDRVEISIIEEAQPRWLSFLNGQYDFLDRLPNDFAPQVVPNGKLAPNLEKKGLVVVRSPMIESIIVTFFNLEHPLVGGYTPEKVALRRAIGLAYDTDSEIRIVRRGQAIPAQGPIGPMATGYNAKLKSEMSDYDPQRAKALLDLYGYIDRDGDGWREQPNGEPLLLELASQPDQQSRQLDELMQKNMNAIGLRMVFKKAKWPENLKASHAGKLMMWGVAWGADNPDGETFLGLGYGPNKGGSNHARFNLPAYNALFNQQSALPDGPERERLMEEASKLMVAYMPYKFTGHRIATDMMYPWVIGYDRNTFVRDFYTYVDIDLDVQRKAAAK
ncbi:MAG TPA: ABC transporter substrate-binding protein [Rhizobacter sp.]|nr:ABC transporter substrate-binding protein [Rhizobacter sp.]